MGCAMLGSDLAVHAFANHSPASSWSMHDSVLLMRCIVTLSSPLKDFAENELLSFAGQWDERTYFPVEVLRESAKQGYGSIFCGHDVGGLQYGFFGLCWSGQSKAAEKECKPGLLPPHVDSSGWGYLD